MSLTKPLSRDEILQGLPAGRARTALFLIEARTAMAAARRQQVVDLVPSETDAQALNQAYLQAIRQSSELPRQPTIQEIEQYAASWVDLAPTTPQLRAALLQLLGAKYRFTAQVTPAIGAALGADTLVVQQAYQRSYGKPLTTIYAPHVTWRSRPAWAMSAVGGWLERLSPFWHATVLICTMSFPQAVLALSLVLAGMGPLPGVGLIVLFGLLSMITIAALAEAVARSSTIRYGYAYLGRVAGDYLGNGAATVMSLALGGFALLGTIAAFVGFAKTLAGLTPIPAVAWVAVLFALNVYRQARQALKLSLVMCLLLAGLVVILLLILGVLALTQLQWQNLLPPLSADAPPRSGGGWPSLVGQATIGVLLTAFYGHITVSQTARVILPRDPSGRALMGGSIMAFVLFTSFFVLWHLAVSGAVAPPRLVVAATGTVLIPLAATLDATGSSLRPLAQGISSLLVILLPGLASIRSADVLFNLVRERLPQPWLARRGLSDRQRLWLCITPVILVFILAEAMVLRGFGSFTHLISISGVLAVSIFAGVLPVLMLLSSRRTGDIVPSGIRPVIGQPWLMGGIYLFFIGIILLHGLVIWQAPLERAAALLLVAAILILTVWVVRRGAFTPRLTIELRQDQRAGAQAHFALTAIGQPLPAAVEFVYPHGTIYSQAASGPVTDFEQLQQVAFALPATAASQIKVWVHRVTEVGNSEALPAQVRLRSDSAISDGAIAEGNWQSLGGATVLPLGNGRCRVQIAFAVPAIG